MTEKEGKVRVYIDDEGIHDIELMDEQELRVSLRRAVDTIDELQRRYRKLLKEKRTQ